MNFEFATSAKIIFGNGSVKQVRKEAAALGSRCLIVTGKNKDRATCIIKQLEDAALNYACFSIDAEPTIECVKHGAIQAITMDAKCIIGIGGGSVIDGAKAIAALATNKDDPLNYLEVIGNGQPLTCSPLPYIAVPTTAGTGAEATKNSVLTSPENKVKVSLRHPSMLPNVAIVDPQLTYSMPAHITASTGLDALAQLIEPFVSRFANPLTDSLCREGIMRISRSLRIACQEPLNQTAREDMALASLFGGIALANSKLGAVHGIAGPLGGMINAPHGELCARLLPYVTEVNINILQKDDIDADALLRYKEVSSILNRRQDATVIDLIHYLHELNCDLKISSLKKHGASTAMFPELAMKAMRASSMKGNPIKLSSAQINEIMTNAI